MTPTGAEYYSGFNPNTATTVEKGQGPMGVTFAKGSTKANVVLRGRGITAVALGVIVSTDFGDAPDSYGKAGSVYQPKWTGDKIRNGWTVMTQPLANLTTESVNPVIGASSNPNYNIDSEPAQLHAADASGDDNAWTNGYDDENGFDGSELAKARFAIPPIQKIAPGETYSISVPVRGDYSGNSKITGWIDWNANGKFDAATEGATTVTVWGQQTATLTFKMPDDVNRQLTQSFLRLRVTNDSGEMSPIGVMETLTRPKYWPLGT